MEQRISSNPEPDKVLVERARGGDRDAFDELVVRYQDRVYNMSLRILGHREDAMDVVQEIFITVFKSLKRFESKAQFSTWLYRVTVNRCRDELRRRGMVKHTRPMSLDARRAADDEGIGTDPAARGPSPEETAVGRETEAFVTRAIAQLPEDAREVLVLRDVQDLSYDEIGAVLDVPVGTVRSRLNRARTLLKEKLRPILEADS